jgi:glycyl-tRNA synthetase
MAQHPAPVKVELPAKLNANRDKIEDLLKRRFFFVPSFSIYGGVRGLFDYGPPGCAIKANLLNAWRQHFVLEDSMLEIDCTCLTPEIVLETSGHVAKFQDYMVRDEVTKECYRADHLLKDRLDALLELEKDPKKREEYLACKGNIDNFDQAELGAKIKHYECKAPETKNEVSAPFPFNLMFPTPIGPTGMLKGYLRPETAQGIIVNFSKFLDYNGGKLPFAAAQIGLAFRNEISPRAGLLRVREFTMAEIEHFVRGDRKQHPKFASVANLKLYFFPREAQLGDRKALEMTIGQAVGQGIVNNETLGYYMARTALFLWSIGVKREYTRFRQHLPNEMAHYACDCWDAEILTTYGWVECVGHADRSAYDLTSHARVSKARLTAYEPYDQPRLTTVLEAKPNKGAIGKACGKDTQMIIEALASMEHEELAKLQTEMAANKKVTFKSHVLTEAMLTFATVEKKVSGENFFPHIIEPSFGIGRIIYALLEHAFAAREGDEQRQYLTLSPLIAPVKCSILPLIASEKLHPFVARIAHVLTAANISSKVDDSGATIGRRYARTDEIGVPYGLTIDFQTVEDDTVTLRDLRTTQQVRLKIADLADTIGSLCTLRQRWDDVVKRFPVFVHKEDGKDEKQ